MRKKVFDYRKYVEDETTLYILDYYIDRLQEYGENAWEYKAQGDPISNMIQERWTVNAELAEKFTIEQMIKIVKARILKLEKGK